MKQASLKLNLNIKKTRKLVLLDQMDQVVSWSALIELIAPYYPEGKNGRPPFSLQTILRFRHRLEKHKLAEQILSVVNDILIQRGLMLKAGTVVDATLIAAPSSTKNKGHKMVRGKLMGAQGWVCLTAKKMPARTQKQPMGAKSGITLKGCASNSAI